MLRQLANTPTIAIAPGDGQHTFMQSSRSSRLAAQHFRCREGTGHVALLHRNVTANLGTAHADCQETDLNRVKTAGAASTGSLRQRRCCVQASGCSSKTWLCKRRHLAGNYANGENFDRRKRFIYASGEICSLGTYHSDVYNVRTFNFAMSTRRKELDKL